MLLLITEVRGGAGRGRAEERQTKPPGAGGCWEFGIDKSAPREGCKMKIRTNWTLFPFFIVHPERVKKVRGRGRRRSERV